MEAAPKRKFLSRYHDAAEGQRDKARRIAKELRDAIVRPQSHPLPWK